MTKRNRRNNLKTGFRRNWHEDAQQAGIDSVRWFWPKKIHGYPSIETQWEQYINMRWGEWFEKQGFAEIPTKSYPLACHRFLHGFCSAANINVEVDILLPTAKKVGCVISAVDEYKALQLQLNELQRLPLEEVIIVLNGSNSELFRMVREHPVGATIIYFDKTLGYDVGRAIGARIASSEILLFLDSDMSIEIENLLPFIYEVSKGADVVLNPITPHLPRSFQWDSISNIKYFLNLCLERTDLQANSLTAVPHALSRRAIDTIGPDVLAVPPLAQARAIRSGLVVTNAPNFIDVIHKNLIREHNVGKMNRVEQLILGDHLEAIHDSTKEIGVRLQFSDQHIRRRELIRKGVE